MLTTIIVKLRREIGLGARFFMFFCEFFLGGKFFFFFLQLWDHFIHILKYMSKFFQVIIFKNRVVVGRNPWTFAARTCHLRDM